MLCSIGTMASLLDVEGSAGAEIGAEGGGADAGAGAGAETKAEASEGALALALQDLGNVMEGSSRF